MLLLLLTPLFPIPLTPYPHFNPQSCSVWGFSFPYFILQNEILEDVDVRREVHMKKKMKKRALGNACISIVISETKSNILK